VTAEEKVAEKTTFSIQYCRKGGPASSFLEFGKRAMCAYQIKDSSK